jgi:hypothetical protein
MIHSKVRKAKRAKPAPANALLDAEEQLTRTRQHGNPTARQAAEILLRSNQGFIVPTAAQKKRIVVAFAKRGRIVYGKAYDIVQMPRGKSIDLDDQEAIERQLSSLTLYEIKSTKRPKIDREFAKYFFALTTAELLVAQSLKAQFRFIFVNVCNGHFKQLSLSEVLAKARGFYPQWSICF